MPDYFDKYRQPAAPASSGDYFDKYRSNVPEPQDAPDDINPEGYEIGGALTGGALLAGAAALATRNPGALSKLFKTGNAVRQQLMLSGLAVPKSALGNTGALVNTAIERRSMQPLKELFSGRVLRDSVRNYRAGATGSNVHNTGVTLPGPNPGKVMGAMDEATQAALQRSGLTPEEAATEVLQAPLGQNFGKMGDALEGPVMEHIIPFRRTPFNQFFEGAKTLTPGHAHKGVTAGYLGAGAVHGVATADERYPTSIPLATALAAKYGMPYALAAVAARKLLGGAEEGGGILGSALPVSEYGVEQSLSEPFKPFTEPAISRFFK